MSNDKVIYEIFDPSGEIIASFDSRKEAKEFINMKNADVPSWHYDELHKMGAKVVKT